MKEKRQEAQAERKKMRGNRSTRGRAKAGGY